MQDEDRPGIWPQPLDQDVSSRPLPVGADLPEVQIVNPSWQLDISRFRKFSDLTGQSKRARRFYHEQNRQVPSRTSETSGPIMQGCRQVDTFVELRDLESGPTAESEAAERAAEEKQSSTLLVVVVSWSCDDLLFVVVSQAR